jgi:hypothetical protein
MSNLGRERKGKQVIFLTFIWHIFPSVAAKEFWVNYIVSIADRGRRRPRDGRQYYV